MGSRNPNQSVTKISKAVDACVQLGSTVASMNNDASISVSNWETLPSVSGVAERAAD